MESSDSGSTLRPSNKKEVGSMKKKLILAGALSAMMIGSIPAFAATGQHMPASFQTQDAQQGPQQNGNQPPEPPKDADGNPLPPPNMQQGQNGNQPPEPPKDADGNPLPPPNMQQGQNGNQPPEPPKDADGNPLPPPNMQQGQGQHPFHSGNDTAEQD